MARETKGVQLTILHVIFANVVENESFRFVALLCVRKLLLLFTHDFAAVDASISTGPAFIVQSDQVLASGASVIAVSVYLLTSQWAFLAFLDFLLALACFVSEKIQETHLYLPKMEIR